MYDTTPHSSGYVTNIGATLDDVWRPDVPARLGTGVEGSLRSVARVILSQASLDPTRSARLALIAERASGSMTGKLEMAVPIYAPAGAPPPRPVGDVRITGAGLKDAVGGHDLSGGQFAIQLGTKVITARGDMRIDGVATKVDWHHIYDAEPGRQPPVRLRARLDEADRELLAKIEAGRLELEFDALYLGQQRLELRAEVAAVGETTTTSVASTGGSDIRETVIPARNPVPVSAASMKLPRPLARIFVARPGGGSNSNAVVP